MAAAAADDDTALPILTSSWRRSKKMPSKRPIAVRLLETRPPPSTPTPTRVPHLPARVSPFSSAVAVAATVPHDARDSGLGSSAYWAWIRAAAEAAPAPAPPQEEEEEGPAHYIPVNAYCLSTTIDLKSLQAEHGTDVVPPSTRSLNYIALRYSEFPPEIMDIGVKDNRFCYRYVVVFQYGSDVLFNIADHEAEHYLEMIRNHASGWLPEMRKDDRYSMHPIDCGPDMLEKMQSDGRRSHVFFDLIRYVNATGEPPCSTYNIAIACPCTHLHEDDARISMYQHCKRTSTIYSYQRFR